MQSIKRYITAFQRVVTLHRGGTAAPQIAFLVGISERLVRDYLALYERIQGQAERLAKLEEELGRVSGMEEGAKKGALKA